MNFTDTQKKLIEAPINQKTFLAGLAGVGKTTASTAWLEKLLTNNIPADRILLFSPQRSYQEPYKIFLSQKSITNNDIQMATLGGLARRNIDLFWPVIAEQAGFSHPELPPTFLTLETAQYQMMSILQPHLDSGKFSSVIVDKNRLSSQILDNLNKSAMVSLDHHSIGDRLTSAWSGDKNYLKVYQDTQECINLFRKKCLKENFLDHSLQIEVFQKFLWKNDLVNHHLRASVDHILYDNIEEDFPVSHDIIADWSSSCLSTVFVLDEAAGYRKFLGADPISAERLKKPCDVILPFEEPVEQKRHFRTFRLGLQRTLVDKLPLATSSINKADYRNEIKFISSKYFPELIDNVVDQIETLINGSEIKPSDIAIIAPYLNDSLWFPLQQRLASKGIPTMIQRPSRSFIDEPIINCMLTLAKLSHPNWKLIPTITDFTHMLFQCIDGIDLVRAKLLSEIVYRGNLKLTSFTQINPEMRKRVKEEFGQQYEVLRNWVEAYKSDQPLPLDHFFRKLFGEVLSQPGFQLHQQSGNVKMLAQLVESIQKFRQSVDPSYKQDTNEFVAKEYIDLISNGIISAKYQDKEQEIIGNEIMIAPAFTYLILGKTCKIQFWMDAGSVGWFERIDQPLTHPYVLSRNWPQGKKWTDLDEYESNMVTMHNLLNGLIRKCSGNIFIGYSQYTDSGYEQKGPLIQVLQKLL